MKPILAVFILLATFASFLTTSAQAQAVPGSTTTPSAKKDGVKDEETKDHWWDCTLPGGNFTVHVGKITSVSMHQYIVKSPAQSANAAPLPSRVYEVNVATDTAQVTRFYYIESAVDGGQSNIVKTGIDRLNDVANRVADKTGSAKFWQLVQKDYPQTTHAHTVEFRLDSKDDLDRLFGSVKRSWMVGRGARFTIVNQ